MKLLLSLVALYALAAVTVEARPADQNIRFNCFVKHLKALKMLEDDFQNFPGPISEDCDGLIESVSQAIFEAAINKQRKTVTPTIRECFMSKYTTEKFPENTFLVVVLKHTESLPPKEKTERYNDQKQKNVDLVMRVINSCVYNDVYADFFEELIALRSSFMAGIDFSADNYCIHKYIAEKNLIDSSYNFIINPSNLNVSEMNCDGIMKKLEKTVMERIMEKLPEKYQNDESRPCAYEKYVRQGYVEKSMATEFLGEVHLTDAQREAEKKNYIDFMSNLSKSLTPCIIQKVVF